MIRLKIYLRYTLLLFAAFAFTSSYAQNTFRTTTKSVIGFLEYLPQGYNGNSNKYPVVIFLHGLGERGPCTTDIATLKAGIGTVERNGPPKYTKAGTQFPFILISPQLKNNWTDWPPAYVNEVIEYCKTYLRIDEKRIYLTGLSLGGGGTWTTSLTYPHLFAAIAPVCGSRNSITKACILSSENMPVWAFHGDADSTIPVNRTISMVNAINACMPAPKPLAKITIYPGASHSGCWCYAYKPDHTIHNPNVYDWMLSFVNTNNGSNKVPICNAGIDQTVSVTGITISGTGSDTDGSITSYQWTKISGPAVTLTYANTSKLKLSSLTAGTYIFKLRVTDANGDGDSDYVKIVKQ